MSAASKFPASGQRWKGVIRGEPGTTYTNTGNKVLYQWQCNFANSCGRCIEMANTIGKWWPLPLHHGCSCKNRPIRPGETSDPFLDYREEIRNLDPDQQKRVIGVSAWKLVEAGKVEWSSVVQRTKIRTLQEIVDIEGLAVRDLVAAGIPEEVAQRTWDSVNTPAHKLARTRREDLVAAISRAGQSPDQIREGFARGLVARTGIVGPSGAQFLRRPPPPPSAPAPAPPPPPPAPAVQAGTLWVDWKAKGWKAALEEIAKAKGDRIRAEVVRIGREADAEREAMNDAAEALAKEGLELRSQQLLAEKEGNREEVNRLEALVRKKIAELRVFQDNLENYTHTVAMRVAKAIAPEGVKAARYRDDAKAAVFPGREDYGKVRPFSAVESARAHAEVAKAEAFVAEIVAHKAINQLSYGFAAHPTNTNKQRGYQIYQSRFGFSSIVLSENHPAEIVVHEIGHAIERQVARLVEAAIAFRTYRLAGEQFVFLKLKFPHRGYDDHEKGAKDEFDRVWSGASAYYVGKEYESNEATEIVSMGLEQLYRDAAKLAERDPEFFDFLIGALHGDF